MLSSSVAAVLSPISLSASHSHSRNLVTTCITQHNALRQYTHTTHYLPTVFLSCDLSTVFPLSSSSHSCVFTCIHPSLQVPSFFTLPCCLCCLCFFLLLSDLLLRFPLSTSWQTLFSCLSCLFPNGVLISHDAFINQFGIRFAVVPSPFWSFIILVLPAFPCIHFAFFFCPFCSFGSLSFRMLLASVFSAFTVRSLAFPLLFPT